MDIYDTKAQSHSMGHLRESVELNFAVHGIDKNVRISVGAGCCTPCDEFDDANTTVYLAGKHILLSAFSNVRQENRGTVAEDPPPTLNEWEGTISTS